MASVKIGFFGGSFDPVHFGHLLAAQNAFERGGLDRLVFVPAAQAPLKPADSSSTPYHRVRLLEAALEGDSRFSVSDFEANKSGVSYTVDTARHFRGVYPNDELFWVIGEDQLGKLTQWREIETLASLVTFLVLERPGHRIFATPEITGLRVTRCSGHKIEMSSTEIRERLQRGLNIDFFMPHKAIVYLKENALYV